MNCEKDALLILEEMNIHKPTCTFIRGKAGISLYRVSAGGKHFVIKVFESDEDTREIENYLLLKKLGVRSLPLIAYTDNAILLPDIDASSDYRLGVESDLDNPTVARAIAKWYKELHSKSAEYIADLSMDIYCETDLLTKETLYFIAEKTGTADNALWKAIEENYDEIHNKINALPKTLTYNDFYYDNLIVSKDETSAFMFDYNLLGKGYAYGDIRNVVSSLSPNAANAFCEEYGTSDMEEQIKADAFISPLVTLYFACKKKKFPSYAEEYLEKLRGGEVLISLKEWIGNEL